MEESARGRGGKIWGGRCAAPCCRRHRYRRASRGWTTPREVGCGPWRRFGEDDSCDLPETAHVRLPLRSEGDANKKYPLARSHCAGKKARRPRGSPETTLEARLVWATRERSRAASTSESERGSARPRCALRPTPCTCETRAGGVRARQTSGNVLTKTEGRERIVDGRRASLDNNAVLPVRRPSGNPIDRSKCVRPDFLCTPPR